MFKVGAVSATRLFCSVVAPTGSPESATLRWDPSPWPRSRFFVRLRFGESSKQSVAASRLRSSAPRRPGDPCANTWRGSLCLHHARSKDSRGQRRTASTSPLPTSADLHDPSRLPADQPWLLGIVASAAALCASAAPWPALAAGVLSDTSDCPLETVSQLLQGGEASQATEMLDNLDLNLCQQDPQGAKQLGDLLVDLGRPSEALGAYAVAVGSCGTEQTPSGQRTCAGALFGRAKAHELEANWELAAADYTASLQIQRDPIPFMNRAQALARLEDWASAADDYRAASDLYLQQRDKRMSRIAQAQGAFAQYEAGQLEASKKALEQIGRQVYSSDVRVALVAVYWESGDLAQAENLWQQTCQIPDALCGRYTDKEWLLSYRRWTPRLADAIADFLAMRVTTPEAT